MPVHLVPPNLVGIVIETMHARGLAFLDAVELFKGFQEKLSGGEAALFDRSASISICI
jgi:hypothetical protein